EEPFDYCMNQYAFIYSGAGTNIAIDLAVLAIPIPQLLKLKPNLRRKIFLVCIFSTSSATDDMNGTMIVSMIRIRSIATYGNSANPMYDSLEAAVYSVVEQNVGLFCMYMPKFRPFMSTLYPNCFSSSQADSDFKI
ncbi:hypothetical protein BU23DRAFT_445437, partial [Bimuria novae-zelandiae CBS 107.79]